jgi:colicin import membrane protein
LTWGVNWHSEQSEPAPVKAELWPAVPEPVAQPTAPPEPPPPTPAEVAPVKPVEPVKPPPPPANTERDKPSVEPGIAIDKKKKKEKPEQDKRKTPDKKESKVKKEDKAKEESTSKKEAQAKKQAEEKKAKFEKEEAKRLELKKQKEEDDKRAEAKKLKEEEARRAEEQKRKEDEAKHAEEEKRKQEEAKRAEELKQEQKRKEDEAKRLAEEKRDGEERRKEQINKFKQLGASSTGPTVSSNATQATASSGAYNKKLFDRVKPNINTFPESQLQAVKGNPEAEVLVTCGPNGKILQTELIRRSGNKSWDDTVLKGVEKTGTLPLDENGSCPAKITFVFKLRGD